MKNWWIALLAIAAVGWIVAALRWQTTDMVALSALGLSALALSKTEEKDE